MQLTDDKHLNCIITKYALLHVWARDSHLQEDLCTEILSKCKICN